MFTAAQAIAKLDLALAKAGEDVSVHSVTAGVPDAGVTVRAAVRGFEPDELTGDIRQNDRKVILSPTGLTVEPIKGRKIKIAGKTYNIEHAEPFRMGATVVRYECQVRG